jgi:transcription elongation GreA/GreB family factor
MKTNTPELPPELAQAGDAALEEWFLARIEQPDLPFDTLSAIIASFQSRGHVEKAETYADLLHDTIAQRRGEQHLLSLWELRAAWRGDEPAFAAVCLAKLGAVFAGQARMETLIRNAGFDRNLPAAECLRRLRVLCGLKPGALCWEKTWGLGSVIEILDFDQQVMIDFEKKKAHRMSLAYAAASLRLLADDDLLAKHHRDPEGFAGWVRQDPAAVVKSALQSFGPQSAPALQELLAGRIFPEADWKRFWDAARKQLKADPRVEFPAKRNDPIRLLEREKSYDSAWLSALASERDFDKILTQIEAWKDETASSGAPNIPPAIQDRLDFIIQGAGRSQAANRAHALLLADELGILDSLRNASAYIAALFAPEPIIHTVHQLPVAMIRRLLMFLRRRDKERTASLLFQALPDLAQSPFNEVVETLRNNGEEERVIELLRSPIAAGTATPEMVFWLCRHEEFVGQHTICAMGRLALEVLNAVENDTIIGERLKAKNQLRALLENPEWLPAALAAMEDLDRRQLISRLKRSSAWPTVERNAMIYRLTQPFPELKDSLAEESAAPAAKARRLTSKRSYMEREAQLHKLITEEIPKNSQDIGTARGYGDLRENFEYKSAREMQGILMRRRVELETTLHSTTSTDFEGFQIAVAGMGTCVTLAHADGRQDRYVILGEWDSDERLGIISSKSKLAEALVGHKPGDQIGIPSETGPITVTLAEVSGLPAKIKEWIKGA